MVRARTNLLEGLVAVGVNLVGEGGGEVLLDSLGGAGSVVGDNVQSGKLREVERTVVANWLAPHGA